MKNKQVYEKLIEIPINNDYENLLAYISQDKLTEILFKKLI